MKKLLNKIKKIIPVVIAIAMIFENAASLHFFPSVSALSNTIGVWENDPVTDGKYEEIFNQNTLNTGKVLTDKSVDSQFSFNEDADPVTVSAEQGNQVVQLSAMSESSSLYINVGGAVDVVYILDLSASMRDYIDGKSKARAMVEATNESINSLMEMNPNNRAAVVGYNDYAYTMMEMGRYGTNPLSISDSATSSWKITGPSGRGDIYTGKEDMGGATNIHRGLIHGFDVFNDVDTTVSIDGNLVKRTPAVVLLSDGAPTKALWVSYNDYDWWSIDDGSQVGPGNLPYSGNGFLAVTTAAKRKESVAAKYKVPCNFYTIGVGLESLITSSNPIDQGLGQLAEVTMNPKDIWDSTANPYAAEMRNYIDQMNDTINWDDPVNLKVDHPKLSPNHYLMPIKRTPWRSEIKYNDEYWPVETIDELNKAFDEISDKVAEEIIAGKHVYPTDVGTGDDLNHQGYITIEDEIGQYTEVKDVKGVLGNNGQYTDNTSFDYNSLGTDKTAFDSSFTKRMQMISNAENAEITQLISDAVSVGQLSTDKNYVAWFAGEKDENGKYDYLGLYNETTAATIPDGATKIIRSYFFYNSDYKTALEGNSTNLMYLTLNLETDIATKNQKMTVQIPAALIPLTKATLVRPDSALNKAEFAEPIRIFYEVGMQKEINESTMGDIVDKEYMQENSAGGKSCYFYTNEHIRETKEAKTIATFTPNAENPFYYFTANTMIYSDKDINTPVTNLEIGQKYYYQYYYYDMHRPDVMGDIHEQWVEFTYSDTKSENSYVASDFAVNANGEYFLKTKVRKINSQNNYTNIKTENVTQTAPYVDSGTWDNSAAQVVTLLGNNARNIVESLTRLVVEKKVSGESGIVIPDKEFTFEIMINSDLFEAPAGETIEKTAQLVTLQSNGESVSSDITLQFDDQRTTRYNLKANQRLIITGIPDNTPYTVTEINIPSNFETQNSENSGIIIGNTVVTVLNEFALPPLNFGTQISGEKQIIGREFKPGDQFTFLIQPVGEAPQPNNDKITINPQSGTTANISFDNVFTFTEPGTYEYLVTEVIDNPGILGITYDTTVYKITVDVIQDGEQLKVNSYSVQKKTSSDPETWEDTSSKITFVNTYEMTGQLVGQNNLKVQKIFTGRKDNAWLDKDAFTFKLEAGNDATKQAVTDGKVILPSNASGITIDKNSSVKEAIFGNIFFKEAGEYVFAISEVLPAGVTVDNPVKDGITYDTTVRYITVRVTQQGVDLIVEVTDADSLVFNNVYNVEDGHLGGTDGKLTVEKSLIGRPGNAWTDSDVFKFKITPYGQSTITAVNNGYVVMPSNSNEIVIDKDTANKEAAFGEIVFKQEGTYQFAVQEILPNGVTSDLPVKDDMTYDTSIKIITVVVTDDGNGHLVATITAESDALVFVNVYGPTVVFNDGVILKVIKDFTGRKDNVWLDGDSFTFVLEGADQNTIQKIQSGDIILPGGKESVTVTIDKNDSIKEAVFGNLVFRTAGSFYFKITEVAGTIPGVTYDGHEYLINVVVTQNSEGKLSAAATVVSGEGSNVFVNTYTPGTVGTDENPGVTDLAGVKVLTGKNLNGGEFTFVIEALNGAPEPPIKEITNNKDGTFNFGNITFDKEGDYSYKITEKVENRPGYVYDRTEYIVTFIVRDNPETGKLEIARVIMANGVLVNQIIFRNSYMPENKLPDIVYGDEIAGIKNIISTNTGYDMVGGEFVFNMYGVSAVDENNQPISNWPKDKITVTNSADGNFIFPHIVFTQPGKYTYVIMEDTTNVKPEFVYDLALYIVVFHVTYDTNSNSLKCDTTITQNGVETDVVFNNVYAPNDAQIIRDIEGIKILEGRPLKEGEFKFVITAAEGTPMPDVTEITNHSDGSFRFENINFTEPGVYEYEIKEVVEALGGIVYDNTIYKVIVTVTEQNGFLTADVQYEKNGVNTDLIIFVNRYIPKEITVGENGELSGIKTLDGRELNSGEFIFELRDEQGNLISTATNDKDGKFSFDHLVFDKAGTYVYTVTEKVGDKTGIIYDKRSYKIVVEVTDDNVGNLSVSVNKYNDQGGIVDTFEFVNKYDPNAVDVWLNGVKNLNGGILEDGMFTFILKDENGTIVKEVKNNKDGTIDFGPLSFNDPGEYVFAVQEKDEQNPLYVYDSTIYTVKVVVADNKEGSLIAEIEYLNGPLVFYNSVRGSMPDTGDTNNLAVSATVFGLSFVFVIAVFVYGRRKRDE